MTPEGAAANPHPHLSASASAPAPSSDPPPLDPSDPSAGPPRPPLPYHPPSCAQLHPASTPSPASRTHPLPAVPVSPTASSTSVPASTSPPTPRAACHHPPCASPRLSAAAPAFRPTSPSSAAFRPTSPSSAAFRPTSPSAPTFQPTSPPSPLSDGKPLRKIPRPTKKMTVDELRAALAKNGLDASGKKESLYKRLWDAWERQCAEEERAANAVARAKRSAALAESSAMRGVDQPNTWYLCFDVEATCMAGRGQFDYPNEIIEFPVVLMAWRYDVDMLPDGRPHIINPHIVHIDTFHQYVRPTWRPQLSQFCTSLTGIQQSTVDASLTFPEVLLELECWLRRWGLLENDELKNAIWVTDGPWDLQDFVPKQLHITPTNPPRYPKYFLGRYLNIKEAVRTVRAEEQRRRALVHTDPSRITTSRRTKRQGGGSPPLTIADQLTALGLSPFEGRQHSGIDDASNIARILQAIGARGVHIETNATLSTSNARRYAWMGQLGEVLWNKPADPIGVEASLARMTLDDKDDGSTSARHSLTAICATS